MEENTSMIIIIMRSNENPRNEYGFEVPITTSTCPTWKLYENPYYNCSQHQQQQQQQQHQEEKENPIHHRIHLPISASKIAASFWDLTFIKPSLLMESELDVSRAQVVELKAELEYERKARKKMECTNKKLAKQVCEEKRGREALERVCQDMAKEMAAYKAEMHEERKMIRIAEVLREERVQMKLSEAKNLLEDKLLELQDATNYNLRMQIGEAIESISLLSSSTTAAAAQVKNNQHDITTNAQQQITRGTKYFYGHRETKTRFVNGRKSDHLNDHSNHIIMRGSSSDQPENPHIKRGIKGFVEFQKVVRAIGRIQK